MADQTNTDGRRAFFKTVGRTLMLGAAGAGSWAMIRNGRIEVCIDETGPCASCINVKRGCELPKAEAFRRSDKDERGS